jgi:hypothetical protein
MSSEHHFLDPMFLKDQISEAIEAMREMQRHFEFCQKRKYCVQLAERYCHGMQYVCEMRLSKQGDDKFV